MTTEYLEGPLLAGSPDRGPLSETAMYFEYTKAVDPIASGSVSAVPVARFGAELYSSGPSRVVPLDVAAELRVAAPATSPSLCANFVRVNAGDQMPFEVNATSQLFHVISGAGTASVDGQSVRWAKGDYLTAPAGCRVVCTADEDTALYWVHDEPLMRYLGAKASVPQFVPTFYPASDAERCLAQVARDPEATRRSRMSVLLANSAMDQTLTVTHVLWAMFGLVPEDAVQPPHRHQSVALDLVLDCQPGCYTLLGRLDEDGKRLVDLQRVDWEPGAVFITPPGHWHSHHNESGAPAHIIPVQDAGLQAYLRSLDIRFMSVPQAHQVLGAVARPEGASVFGEEQLALR